MSFYPRSATVRAKTDCVMLEMLRNVCSTCCRRTRPSANNSTAIIVNGRLRTHLLSVPSSPRSMKTSSPICKTRSSLVRFAPGQVITEEGADADAFYLVRIGFVKVSQVHRGEALVLAYLPRGGYFGEMDCSRSSETKWRESAPRPAPRSITSSWSRYPPKTSMRC